MKHLQPLLLITIALILCLVGGCRSDEKSTYVAERGVLDLSGWDPALDGPVALDGQWEFYWDRLLTPEDFADGGSAQIKSGYLTFPGFWKKYELNGHLLPGTGQATFRLRVLPAPGVRQLTMQLFSLPAAYTIWADGILVASSGKVGRSDEVEIPERSFVFGTISSDGSPIDLVMQLSNHHFFRGGVQNPIMLAEPGPLEQAHSNTRSWGLLFVGCMLIMSVYHFILFFLRRKDVSTLYFGLYCIVLTVLVAAVDSSHWLVRAYLPNIAFLSVSKIVLCSYAVSTSILYRFYRSLYPKEFVRFLLYIIDIRAAVFAFIVLTQPGTVVHTALQLFALSAVFFTACFFCLLFICFRRGYSGSLILLCGIFILGATSTHDIYYIIFSTHVESILPLGLFGLVLSQAVALAHVFPNPLPMLKASPKNLKSKM